jgi:hypothetical protein
MSQSPLRNPSPSRVPGKSFSIRDLMTLGSRGEWNQQGRKTKQRADGSAISSTKCFKPSIDSQPPVFLFYSFGLTLARLVMDRDGNSQIPDAGQ